ncbi:MAG TPA: hypothetical protein VFA70_13555, partial [Dehalococcoidia bacterium]|nr:hypothetical protein [Dehalococcoidia bacterium]
MRNELAAVARSGLRIVRLLLPWDAFMPEPSRVPDRRMRQLDSVLAVCDAESLQAVPVLNAQSLGGCVMLPPYAIDAFRRASGVRVVTDGVVQPGAPRDQHTDPLLLDVQLRWLETLLTAFAGHDAILMWDLGHDPAATMRPRRIEQQKRWCHLLATAVHAHGERCTLTLGSDDLVTARGVRPGELAPLLDVIGVAAAAAAARTATAVADLALLAHLVMRMSGSGTPVAVHVPAPLPPTDPRRFAA